MKVTGSMNEIYTLESRKKMVYNGYTDYQVCGGAYIARIFDRSLRKKDVEAVLCRIVYEGTRYGDQRPLNVLYSHGCFYGFLYEGTIPEMSQVNEVGNMDYANNNNCFRPAVWSNFISDDDVLDVVIQIVIAIAMGIVAIIGVHPFLKNYLLDHVESGIAQMLYFLDYLGIPALIVGLFFQISVSRRVKNFVNNVILCGLVAMVANLFGSIAWTALVMILITLVQGIVALFLRYLAVIILGWIIFRWLKKKG